MQNDLTLRDEDRLFSCLRELYSGCGYLPYKVRKFEEYSLYLENRTFLTSEYVITFNDLNGKLLALKPDITLSVVKNSKATRTKSEKYFYRESVYRLDKHTKEYREISQIGLECLGNIDAATTLEIILLALETLRRVDEDCVLTLSHMGIFTGLCHSMNLSADLRSSIAACITGRNRHDLSRVCREGGLQEESTACFVRLLDAKGDYGTALASLLPLTHIPEVQEAYQELKALEEGLQGVDGSDRIKLDFSLLNDTDYYTGIVMEGYVSRLHQALLCGGRYDKLMRKFQSEADAMGFALYTGDLAFRYGLRPAMDADVLLLYTTDDRPADVLRASAQLRTQGLTVRTEAAMPEGLVFGTTKTVKEVLV